MSDKHGKAAIFNHITEKADTFATTPSPRHLCSLLSGMLPFGLIIALLFEGASARAPHSPEDPYAFPKYRINFLNNHPVASAQANLWLEQGLKEGVQEFLGTYHTIYENDWPRLEASGDQAVLPSPTPQPKLKKIKLGPKRSYVCLIPPTLESAPREFEEPAPADPAKSWQLLQPLAGHCLYHKQGWFTYAYCHNQYVRQFREMEHTHPHPPGGRIPQEDTEFQAYTLGKSPLALRAKNTEVAVPDDSEEAKNALQLSEGAGQRYLTSRWTDGTLCDKTGRPREVEVQFHCSMTTTDQIQFLKETSVCQYILVVHTPRLCGEPGFQSARDKTPAAPIHCREMIGEEDMPAAIEMRRTLPEAPFPDNSFRRNPIHIPNLPLQAQRRAEAESLGLSLDGLSPKLQSLENALNKLLGGSYKFESLTGERPLNKKGNPLKNLEEAKGKGGNQQQQQQQQGQQQQQQNAPASLADLLADMDVGTPIRTEDGEEVYVQVIDLDDAGDLQGDDLIRRVQEALAGKGKSKRKSKKEKEQEEEEEERYADDIFYFEDFD